MCTPVCLDPQALRARGVWWIVAPYEADAQMALLALRGEVHAVVTEDSDLLAYGCPRVSTCTSGDSVLVCVNMGLPPHGCKHMRDVQECGHL